MTDNDIINADCVWISVDMSDQKWAERFTKVTGRRPNVDRYSTVAGELECSVASCYKYMPWHKGRKIVVTDDQDLSIPKYAELVDVRDYLPEEYYPTFNSDPLQLHQDLIPEISDIFVSWDDDIFLTKEIEPDVFHSDGKLACYGFRLGRQLKDKGGDGRWGTMQTILYRANPKWDFFNSHMPHILSKSACREVRRNHPQLVHAASMDKVRGVNWLGGTDGVHSLASGHFTPIINDGRGTPITEYLGYPDLVRNGYKRKTDRPFLCVNNYAGYQPLQYMEFLQGL